MRRVPCVLVTVYAKRGKRGSYATQTFEYRTTKLRTYTCPYECTVPSYANFIKEDKFVGKPRNLARLVNIRSHLHTYISTIGGRFSAFFLPTNGTRRSQKKKKEQKVSS